VSENGARGEDGGRDVSEFRRGMVGRPGGDEVGTGDKSRRRLGAFENNHEYLSKAIKPTYHGWIRIFRTRRATLSIL
jgi:hypothetical protein